MYVILRECMYMKPCDNTELTLLKKTARYGQKLLINLHCIIALNFSPLDKACCYIVCKNKCFQLFLTSFLVSLILLSLYHIDTCN